MYVIDTNIVVKWFADEEYSNKALTILDNYKLGKFNITIPDLLIYEFVNVLRFNKSFNSDEKKDCIRSLYDLDLYFVTPYHTLIEKARNIAEDYNITVYDATFVALAKEMRCDFITADEKLYNKISNIPHIKLLSKVETI